MSLTSVISNSNKVPGIYLQVSFGVGPRSAGDAPRKVILFGNKTSAGTLAAATPTQCLTKDDAATLTGIGSELYRMVVAALDVSSTVDLYVCVVAESAGTNASATVTYTGTSTADGAQTVWVCGEPCVASVTSGDTVTTIAAAMKAAINAKTTLPVTADNSSGVLTVTAKHKGPRGNYISLRSLSEATGITATTSASYLASGATTDDPQTAIDATDASHYTYLVSPYQDATQLAKFKTQVNAQAVPEVGLREQVIFGSIDTLANTTTVATGLNAARMQAVWVYNGDSMPCELAAAKAAFRADAEGADPSANMDNQIVVGMKVPVAEADWPTNAELVSALNNGITPLKPVNGEMAIVRSITTRSQTSGGTADYAVLDVSKVTVPDYVADTLEANYSTWDGFKLADDDADGAPPPTNVATPKLLKDWAFGLLKDIEADGHIVNVDDLAASLVFEVSATAGRVNAQVPVDVIEGLHQMAADVRQVG
jgi:phage tail sheath gpL-like